MSVESASYGATEVARSIRLRSTRGLAYEAKVAFQSGAGEKPSPSAVVDRIEGAPSSVSYTRPASGPPQKCFHKCTRAESPSGASEAEGPHSRLRLR